jgi:uncharacterized protein (TIGR02246 family)
LLAVILALLAGLGFSSNAWAKDQHASRDVSQIRAVLDDQAQAWNRGDIEKFMTGYWKSDETTFVGATGVKNGWQAILENYRKRYPDRAAMGKLEFSNLDIRVIDKRAAYALGEFKLQRAEGAVSGYFTLVFRKFSQGWCIVSDHTTVGSPNKE